MKCKVILDDKDQYFIKHNDQYLYVGKDLTSALMVQGIISSTDEDTDTVYVNRTGFYYKTKVMVNPRPLITWSLSIIPTFTEPRPINWRVVDEAGQWDGRNLKPEIAKFEFAQPYKLKSNMKYSQRVNGDGELELLIQQSNGLVIYYGGPGVHELNKLVENLNISPRANVEGRDDGLYVCWGEHERHEACEYQKTIAYDESYMNKQKLFRAVDNFNAKVAKSTANTEEVCREKTPTSKDLETPFPALTRMMELMRNTPVVIERQRPDLSLIRANIWQATYLAELKDRNSAYAEVVANQILQKFDRNFIK